MGICVILGLKGRIEAWKNRYLEGKSIAEEFAKKEFKSYIIIDFAHTSKAIKDLFDDTYDLDFFFLQLQQLTGTRLFEKESVIIHGTFFIKGCDIIALKEAKAIYRIRRIVLVNTDIIDEYIENFRDI